MRLFTGLPPLRLTVTKLQAPFRLNPQTKAGAYPSRVAYPTAAAQPGEPIPDAYVSAFRDRVVHEDPDPAVGDVPA